MLSSEEGVKIKFCVFCLSETHHTLTEAYGNVASVRVVHAFSWRSQKTIVAVAALPVTEALSPRESTVNKTLAWKLYANYEALSEGNVQKAIGFATPVRSM